MHRAIAAVVIAGLVAGCSDDATPAGEPSADERRRSDVADAGEDPPHDLVRFFVGDIQLQGVEQQSYQASVPANVTIVEAQLETPGPITRLDGIVFELAGCGGFAVPAGYTTLGGGGSYRFRICPDATSGDHTLTVRSEGATTLIDGRVQLDGHVPKTNATTPAPSSASGTVTRQAQHP